MSRSIAIIHAFLSVRGGAEGVAFAAIRALLENGDTITLFTAEPEAVVRPILEAALGREAAAKVVIGANRAEGLRRVFSRKPPALLGYALLLRALRGDRRLDAFDIVFSTMGECDLVEGRRQACYVHFPLMPLARSDAARLGGRLARHPWLRETYTRLAAWLAGYRGIPAGALVMTNSAWSGGFVERFTGYRNPVILYPPIRPFPLPGDAPSPPQVRDGLQAISLGRLVSYKGQDLIIRALDRAAAETGTKAKVTFIGRGLQEAADALVAMSTERVQVAVLRDAPDAEVGKAIASAHVGVSAFGFEHFGMATAELMASGLPVLVPDDGGQAEISQSADFLFANEDELSKRFAALIRGDIDIEAMRAHARMRGGSFAGDRFAVELLETLADWREAPR